MSKQQIDENLIKRFLAGQADESERTLVEIFLQKEGSADLFEKVWDEWHQEMNSQPQEEVVDSIRMERWKSDIRKRIEGDLGRHSKTKRLNFKIYRQVAIWATLILGGALWGLHTYFSNPMQDSVENEWITYTTANGKRAIIHLSDSSTIYLGAGSSLSYPKQFVENKREVKLKGEAFFEVSKNPNMPFSVISDEVITQVLGTSFEVEAFEGSSILVSVSTGKVRVAQLVENDEQIFLTDLTAGQRLEWTEKMGVIKTDLVTPGDAAVFMSGKLVFEDRPLIEIAEALKRNYHLNIEIANATLANKPIRISLENNLTRQQIMDVLAATGGFKYRIDKKNDNIKIF